VLGGSLWIIAANIVLYYLMISHPVNRVARGFWASLVLIVPIIISISISTDYTSSQKAEFVVVQPNIDPYTQKFHGTKDFISYDNQLLRLMQLSDSLASEKTDIFLWPETAIQDYHYRGVNERDITSSRQYSVIRQLIKKYPRTALVSGVESWNQYEDSTQKLITSRYDKGEKYYYDKFNAALMLTTDTLTFYHKSRLVPGAETLPWPSVLGVVKKVIAFEYSGNYGKQKEASVFHPTENIHIAPLICYESIYGEYVGDFVRKGANVLAIMTNDGWWKNTEGHRQHQLYAKLRAIEMRRAIARSANTGISSFVMPDGTVLQPTDWWEQTVIKQSLPLVEEITFYARYGDYLGRSSAYLSVLLILSVFVKMIVKDRQK
jgi:apolipoprotein N-acyltransferase